MNWSLGITSVWINVSVTSGTLNPGDPATNVEVSVSPAANALTKGIYTGTIWFTNLTDQSVQSRSFTLRVGQDYFGASGEHRDPWEPVYRLRKIQCISLKTWYALRRWVKRAEKNHPPKPKKVDRGGSLRVKPKGA